ncbi:NB-ARC domain-containing protein [Streptomyces puniciscabiei]|uniref:NB-ARC domain-containing protein n=1 Tax=Streptomyces puniciscabiei TaxID=164348 RepID=A0A542TGX4_9ACTN|nr:tetratricopeptide repeat protein [Streptomyces puniciscabiei]TQK86048.1 NB-ARC domain-containing protein [Streptomyces puniciscabiei]
MADENGNVSNAIIGGVFFHQVLQGRDITLVLPPKVTPAFSGLPAPSPTFIGRDVHVEELLHALAPREEQQAVPQPSRIAVAGLAGVGKTELVVQVAARALREPDWFPGGVLFVDLLGYDPEHLLSPERALDGFLRAVGISGEHIPDSLQDLQRLYRSVLAAFAREGRRILVVVDNASSADQVAPLLPADGMTAVLVTSRHTLDIGARLHDLDVLDTNASIALLHQALLQARGPADARVQDAPDAAAAIADLCAGLPLALRIAAALLSDAPTRPLASLAQALRTEHSRLDRLRREDRAVRAAFDLSYQRLSDVSARLFRLCPLNAGPDLSTESAAALADMDDYTAEEILQDLNRAHLIETSGSAWGRWRMHDLVRLYATDHLKQEGREKQIAALSRLLERYRIMASAASSHLAPDTGSPPSPLFTNRETALEWLEHERANLVGTVTTAHETGAAATAASLAFSLAAFLEQRRCFADWTAVTATALAILQQAGDHQSAARAMTNLGIAQRELRQFDTAVLLLQTAADAFAEAGDRRARAIALDALGVARREMRQYDESIDAHTETAAIFQDLQDLGGQARALNNLGSAWREMHQPGEAIPVLRQALSIMRTTGDHRGEATALVNLGAALRESGQFDEAIALYGGAIPRLRETHDRHGEALALHNRGDALQHIERFSEAIEDHRQAAEIFQRAKENRPLAKALASLAGAYSGDEQHTAAAKISAQAVEIQRQLLHADPTVNAPELARTLCLAAWVRRNGQHDLATALTMTEEGIAIYCDLGAKASPVLSAHFRMALGLQADILDLLGRHQQADTIRRKGLPPDRSS